MCEKDVKKFVRKEICESPTLAQCKNLFKFTIYKCLQYASVCPGKPLQLSLIFTSKARAYLSEAAGLAHKH